MKIELITEDFKGAQYYDIKDCPLCRALSRYFPKEEINVGGFAFKIEGEYYAFDSDIWIPTLVTSLLEEANAGEQVNFTLEIPGL